MMNEGAWFDRLGAVNLDENLPTPLYHQIYLVLREKISTGELPAGATVPGEHDLSRHFGVSRITVKRALNELAAGGLVTRHRGRGTIVAKGHRVPIVRGSFETLIQSLEIMGLVTEVELLGAAEIAADATVAELLDIPVGARVQRAVRRRKLENQPFAHLVTFVPAEIAKCYAVEDLAKMSMLLLLERSGHPTVAADEWISAVSAEPMIATALDVAIGAPLLKVDRVMFGSGGEPIQLIYGHYRPDRFQYHVRTQRRRPAGATVEVGRDDADRISERGPAPALRAAAARDA